MKKHFTAVMFFLIFSQIAIAAEYIWQENNRWTSVDPPPSPLTLETDDTLRIIPDSGAGEKCLGDYMVLTNYGTIIWQDTKTLWTANAGNIDNYGLVDLQSDGYFMKYAEGVTPNSFVNRPGATLRKSGSTGDTILPYTGASPDETQFINYGTLECQSGTLVYAAPLQYYSDGTTFSGCGTHNISISDTVFFDSGDITAASDTTVNFNASLYSAGTAASVYSFDETTLHGEFNLQTGTLKGGIYLSSDSIFNIDSLGDGKFIEESEIENQGQINVNSDLQITNSVIANIGTLDFRDDCQLTTFGTTSQIINLGTIRKTGGTGTCVIGMPGDTDFRFYTEIGLIDVQTGTLSIYAGYLEVMASDIHIAENAKLQLSTNVPEIMNARYLSGTGTIELLDEAALLVNYGTIMPGDTIVDALNNAPPDVGTLTIDANLVQYGEGRLIIEINGNGENEFDQLIVTGDALVKGLIDFQRLPEYTPQVGDTFTFLTANSVTADFTSVFHDFDGISFDILYGDTSLALTVTAIPEPATCLLLGAGTIIILFRRKK